MANETGTKRIQVNISDMVNDMLDELSSVWGVSKSGICAMAIGQYVEGLRRQREMLYGNEGLMEGLKDRIMEQARKQMDEDGTDRR